jgi:hypothetical protein
VAALVGPEESPFTLLDLYYNSESENQRIADEYRLLRDSSRRWSHLAACRLVQGCRKHFNSGGPVWPLVYRKDAQAWWRSRQSSQQGYGALDVVSPVIKRQNDDHDVLDGRDVVRAYWGQHGKGVPPARCRGCVGGIGFVYVMAHHPYRDRFKVGIAVDVTKRARALSCQSGFECRPVGCVQCCCYTMARHVESLIHSMLRQRGVVGEWFAGSDLEAQAVAEVLRESFGRVSARHLRYRDVSPTGVIFDRLRRGIEQLGLVGDDCDDE